MLGQVNVTSALVIIQLAAYTPIWKWYVMRVADQSDEPWGLAALAVALCNVVFVRPYGNPRDRDLWVPSLIILIYAVCYHFVPRLVQGMIAMTALACTLSAARLGTRFHLPTVGLLLLSLPLIPTLQFYLGYPLRSLCAGLAAPLLQLGGFSVEGEGTCLRWGVELVAIDAPCSGVRMLWAGMFLALALSSFLRLSQWRTVALSVVAIAAVILGNVLRAASLFYVEAGILVIPSWCHEAVGTVAFLGLGLIVTKSSFFLRENVGEPLSSKSGSPALLSKNSQYWLSKLIVAASSTSGPPRANPLRREKRSSSGSTGSSRSYVSWRISLSRRG
jgi:exosortase/archaeosortase family protein